MDTVGKILLLCFFLQGVCCRDFNISLPEKIQALSGSCVVIKCRFEINETYNQDLTDTAIGVWLKNGTEVDKNIVFNSSTSDQNSGIKGNITGKLKDKDCTTVFTDIRSNHSGQYFFRIEGEGGLKWTYAQNNVSINVNDSPVRPVVQLYSDQKDLRDDQGVLEGSSVSLRCSAETLCSSPPPTLTWSSTPRIPLSESSRRQELISDLNFTAAHRHHTLTFTCTATYQIQERNATAHRNFTLRVQYAPKIFSFSSCIRSDVTVCFCEANGNPSPKVEWHLSGRPVSKSSHMSISEERLNSTGLRSFISLHQSLTHTFTLECVANNTHGSQTKLIPSGDIVFVLCGVAVASLVVGILCAIACICICNAKRNYLLAKKEEASKRSDQDVDKGTQEKFAKISDQDADKATKEEVVQKSDQDADEATQEEGTKRSDEDAEITVQNDGAIESGQTLHKQATQEGDRKSGQKSFKAVPQEKEAESIYEMMLSVTVKANVETKPKESKESEESEESEEECFEDMTSLYARVNRFNP